MARTHETTEKTYKRIICHRCQKIQLVLVVVENKTLSCRYSKSLLCSPWISSHPIFAKLAGLLWLCAELPTRATSRSVWVVFEKTKQKKRETHTIGCVCCQSRLPCNPAIKMHPSPSGRCTQSKLIFFEFLTCSSVVNGPASFLHGGIPCRCIIYIAQQWYCSLENTLLYKVVFPGCCTIDGPNTVPVDTERFFEQAFSTLHQMIR